MNADEQKKSDKKLRKIGSAAVNMSALIDDIVKNARREFKENGETELDAKFLKESVGALKELFSLLNEYDYSSGNDGVVVRLEKELEEWAK